MLRITREALQAIRDHAEHSFPRECCGLLSSAGECPVIDRVHPCTNIQDRMRMLDPAHFQRSAETAYYVDEIDVLRVQDELDRLGRVLIGVYHSHTRTGPEFSAEDKRWATTSGSPLWPQAHYLIAQVVGGKVESMKSYRWDGSAGDFINEPLVEC